MSTPERPVLPDHPTKQQLDELDALMARMLALPVNQPEEPLSPPKRVAPALAKAEKGESVSPTQPEAARESGVEEKIPQTPVFQNIIVASPGVSRITNEISPKPVLSPPLAADNPIREPTTAVSAERQASAAVSSPRLTGPEFRTPPDRHPSVVVPARLSFWLRPVVECNRVYDSVAAKLGRPGAWLRDTRGRTFLGLTGIALLTAAVAWVLIDSWGWTW
ncbi:MAG TPA: hypothetical protein VGY66_23825 [Gemmataceae bacterium]|jgi:hypothetical protein|nr:hypothetical protein [Gemmataceae bacterium]